MSRQLIDDVVSEPSEVQPAELPEVQPAEPPGVSRPLPPAGPLTPTRAGEDQFRRFWRVLPVLLLLLAGSVGGGIIGAWLAPGRPATSPGQATTPPGSGADLQKAVENVSQGARPSVVEVTSSGPAGTSVASGVILTTYGYIVTNDHMVNGFDTYTVTLASGKAFPARLVGEDAQDDLAVLKIAANGLRPVTFADSSAVKVGQFVIALGSPAGLRNSATLGIISALNRTVSEPSIGPAAELAGLIQTNATLNPGNSGGALLDLQGRFIGMPTLGVASTAGGQDVDGIGFSIPSDRAGFVTAQLIQHGKLIHSGQGFLGVRAQGTPPSGVRVTGFVNNAPTGGSPAQQAGVRIDDIITAIDGQVIVGSDDFVGAILTAPPNTRVTLAITRGAQQLSIPVTLSERPVGA